MNYWCIIIVTLITCICAEHRSLFSRNYERRKINRQKFTALSGTITSPGYPNKYPDLLNMYYEIDLPQNYTIDLRIKDTDIEDNGDKLTVYVVKDNEYQPIEVITGKHSVERTIETNSNMVLLHFATDHGVSGRGFDMEYESSKIGNAKTAETKDELRRASELARKMRHYRMEQLKNELYKRMQL